VWRFSRHETLFALIVAAVAVWIATVVVVLMTQPLLGGDFMQFYTFGKLAIRGEWARQYDWPSFHALQVSLVPESTEYDYPPSYPPLVPALYVPFAALPFGLAFVVWLVSSSVLYMCLVAVAARTWREIPRLHVMLGSLVFPPFVAHQVLGQSTIWPLLGFVGGWWALTYRRRLLGGIILSLVAIKPHLGIALAIVLLATRSWRVIAGIALGGGVQALLTLVICGADAIVAYVRTTLMVLRNPMLIDPTDPRHTHALRTSLERIAPHDLATAVWLAASTLIAWMTIRVWRRNQEWTVRMPTVLFATLLISPHVQTYDAIILAPAVVWLTPWALAVHRSSVVVGLVVLSIVFLMTSARMAGIPLTIPLMTWVLWECRRLGPGSVGRNGDPLSRSGERLTEKPAGQENARG
jgi:hypothetical protein